MEQKLAKLHTYFDQRIALCKEREQALQDSARRDEATFEKIRANIYDIFRTVLNAGVKACQGDEGKLRDFFLQRIRQIPASWKTACDKADQHGDQVQVHIEKLKLQTAEEIEKTFLQIWEEA